MERSMPAAERMIQSDASTVWYSVVMLGLVLASVLIAASPTPAPTSTPIPDPCNSILAIVTRPTVTTSVCTVRAHAVLLETGYTNTTITGPGGGSLTNVPQAFLRVGTGNSHLEFALTPPSAESTTAGGPRTAGTSDMNVGVKYEMGYTQNLAWGVNGVLSVPSGSHAFSAGGAQYTANFNWGYTIDPEFSLSGTLGFNQLAGYNPSGAVQHYFAFIPSAVLSITLPANSQALAEYAWFSQSGPGVGAHGLFDFVLQHDFSPHVQFDIEYGVQPTVLQGQQQHYIGAGLSFMT